MKYEPHPDLRKHLNQQGIRGKRFKFDPQMHADMLARFREWHPTETDDQLHDRVAQRILWKHRKKHNAKWYLKWLAIGAALLLLILAGSSRAEAQVDCVQAQASDGSKVGTTICAPLVLKAGTNTTLTKSGNTITVNAAVGSSANKPFYDMQRDCSLVGDGVTDDSTAANACFTAHPGYGFYFPKTQANNGCSYWFAAQLVPKGDGVSVFGASSGFRNSATTNGGTALCFAAGVSGILLDLSNTTGASVHDLDLQGSEGTTLQFDSTLVNIPSGASLPQYTRSIASIQRTSNVLTVNTTAVGGQEGLTQQVGSQVLISGVVGDATMNGRCIIASFTIYGSFSENPTGFTCAQNGSDAGPFTTDGTLKLATSGASTADGIRVCGNFFTIYRVSIKAFGRHGINADAVAGHGCVNPFADDLIVRDSVLMGNQGSGLYGQGTDFNTGLFESNSLYYNMLWGAEDQSGLGNTWIANNFSNNGSTWIGAGGAVPATKAISSISRTLVSGASTVTVVLSVANNSVKQGSCIVVAGVTDASFNTTAGQCFFVTAYTNSTHFQWEQPGAPADASSSSGTVRMSRFFEAYASSGVDSGAAKMATQSPSSSTSMIYSYVEGAQPCKLHRYVISIGGPTSGCSVTQSTWTPGFINVQGSGGGGLGGILESNLGMITTPVDSDGILYLRPGVSPTARRYKLYWTKYDNSVGWMIDGGTTGTNSDADSLLIGRNGVTGRLRLFGPSTSSGVTKINSESTGAVEINNDASMGTGGLKVCDGAASPVCITFNSATASTVGSAGAASALPATPSGYLIFKVGSTNFKIPYYAN